MPTTTTPTEPLVLDFDGTGRGEGRVAMPPGRYFLGDPCYPFPNKGSHEPRWMELLQSCAFFDADPSESTTESWGPWTGEPGPVGHVTVDGVTYPVLGFSTAYGDGCYPGSDGFEYGVDAGMIGLVPMALFEAMNVAGDGEVDMAYLNRCGTVIEPTAGFLCTREADGTLTFGDVTIETGDPKCSNCEAVLGSEGTCDTCEPRCEDCGSTYCSAAGNWRAECDEADDEADDDEDED